MPSFLAAVGTSGTCCLCPPSPAQIRGARGSLKAAGCREPEHRAQGWGWEHGREEEGCPSHLSKSVLGLSRSKCFLHLCWHSSGAGEPFSGAGPPPGFLWDAPAGMQQPQGKQSIPKSWGQPGESWWQPSPPGRLGRRGIGKPRVMFPFLFAWLWHPRGLLRWGGSMWDKDSPLGEQWH